MQRPIVSGFLDSNNKDLSTNKGALDEIARQRAKGKVVAMVGGAKGGCGKSTTAMNTAVGFARQRRRVLLIDADVRQGTTAEWPLPPDRSNPVIDSGKPEDTVDLVAQRIADFDVVIIDVAGRDDHAIASILEISDILISPTKPAVLDLSQFSHFICIAQALGVPHITIFNEATREDTAEMRRFMAQYVEYGPFLPIAIQQLSSYRRVYPHGRGVLEIRGDSDPAKMNFSRVFEHLQPIIERAHAERNAR